MVMEKKIPNQGGLLIFRKSKLLVTGSASDLIGPATDLFSLSIKSASFALQFLIDLSPKLYFVLFLSFLKLFQKSILDDYDNRFLIVKSVFNNNLEQNSSLFNHSTYCWNLEFASLYSHSPVHASTFWGRTKLPCQTEQDWIWSTHSITSSSSLQVSFILWSSGISLNSQWVSSFDNHLQNVLSSNLAVRKFLKTKNAFMNRLSMRNILTAKNIVVTIP